MRPTISVYKSTIIQSAPLATKDTTTNQNRWPKLQPTPPKTPYPPHQTPQPPYNPHQSAPPSPHPPRPAPQSHSDSPHHRQYGPGRLTRRPRGRFRASQPRCRTRRARSGLVGRRVCRGRGREGGFSVSGPRAFELSLCWCSGRGIYHLGHRNRPSSLVRGGRRRRAIGGRRRLRSCCCC